MAYSLRLPAQLDADARARCERLGISLNALLCVALDAYLREPQPAAATDQTAQAAPKPIESPETAYPVFAAQLTKAQRRELTAQQRQARK